MANDINLLRQDLVVRGRLLLGFAAVVFLATGLAGCGSVGSLAEGDAFVAPNKYAMYTCPELNDRAKAVQARQVELEQVMDRAAQGAGGAFVNAIAYRTEYAQTRGELRLLAKAEEERQCAVRSQWSSGRAVF
jgi:uncharacterized protein YceK